MKKTGIVCRELNRKYVMPIGYERNKLLITDWSEEDFGTLDFYDFYDIFYLLKYGAYVPYEAGSFQYVSNHALSMPGNIEPSWYQPRLTDEEWEKYYGELE